MKIFDDIYFGELKIVEIFVEDELLNKNCL